MYEKKGKARQQVSLNSYAASKVIFRAEGRTKRAIFCKRDLIKESKELLERGRSCREGKRDLGRLAVGQKLSVHK